jgi:glycosyltransferase involved in cell wall biosynthesis
MGRNLHLGLERSRVMPISANVSIIICTCNRADDLRQTLEAIGQLAVPEGYNCDLTVVDNASTDSTAELVKSIMLVNMPLRYLLEPRRGKGYAYNSGIAATTGDVLLFTDDDLRPPPNWLEGMCGPIISGEADAIAGGITLAPQLKRPWMKKEHVGWLASTEYLPSGAITPLIGANMAFSRRVLERVPQFDVEVGPGAKGQGEDSLYCYQLQKAGYQVVMALDTVMEHHLQEARLNRQSFVGLAQKRGESNAYLARHWSHSEPRWPYLTLARAGAALWARRLLHFPEWVTSPTVPAWELRLLETWHTARCHLTERKEPRKYEKFGLVKLR